VKERRESRIENQDEKTAPVLIIDRRHLILFNYAEKIPGAVLILDS
jgi:hypothetical protein